MPLPAPAVAALPWIAAVIDAQAEGVTAPDELKRVAIEAGATEEKWEAGRAPCACGTATVRSEVDSPYGPPGSAP